MSTISSTNLSQLFSAQRPPPSHGGKARVSDAIQSEAASGQISSTDATALTSALDSIDTSLSADRASAQSSSSSSTSSSSTEARLDPSKIKDRIDGLIADQVTNGTLTSDQADTLKQIFSAQAPGGQQGSGGDDQDGFSVDAAGSSGGTGKVHHGHRGPPPGPPPSDTLAADATTNSSTTTGSSASGDAGTGSVTDLLKSFMDQLQASQSNASGYTGGGTSGGLSRQASAMLFDFNS